jgi:hypothetical protein
VREEENQSSLRRTAWLSLTHRYQVQDRAAQDCALFSRQNRNSTQSVVTTKGRSEAGLGFAVEGYEVQATYAERKGQMKEKMEKDGDFDDGCGSKSFNSTAASPFGRGCIGDGMGGWG